MKEKVRTTRVLTKWGNSLGIRLPKFLLKKLNITEGQVLEITLIEDGIIIKKAKEVSSHLTSVMNDFN